MSEYDEGSMWEDYWAEEDRVRREEHDLDRELAQQSRQIQYEADARRSFVD